MTIRLLTIIADLKKESKKHNLIINNLIFIIMAKKFLTNYAVATKWLNNSYILCNNICEIDASVCDNMSFSLYNEDEDGNEEIIDIYQWFISDCSSDDVEYLENTFGLLFSYSDLLDCYVLCVPHYGTAWDYVTVETTNEYAARNLGESK